MRVRLGYVAMTMNLEDASPSGAVTFANLSKISDKEARLRKLRSVAAKNLKNTWRILLYNKAMDIKVYRLTSKLIPLATHQAAEGWDYTSELAQEFKETGDLILLNDFRISAHPDHFTLINSNSPDVLKAAIKDLDYHVRVFEAMGLYDYKYKLVLHVGGLYKDKKGSMERFKENFIQLPERIRKRIILENDDKSFTAEDVLSICEELKIPMVLDVHHYNCVNYGTPLKELLPRIFDTWKEEAYVPKIHFSSPKSPKDFRSHGDYISTEEFFEFLQVSKQYNRDFDVMLEAKKKDDAVFKLVKELESEESVEKITNGEILIQR
jgi:UV damage endonuclease UvdE